MLRKCIIILFFFETYFFRFKFSKREILSVIYLSLFADILYEFGVLPAVHYAAIVNYYKTCKIVFYERIKVGVDIIEIIFLDAK